jgi:hypothetical protein
MEVNRRIRLELAVMSAGPTHRVITALDHPLYHK